MLHYKANFFLLKRYVILFIILSLFSNHLIADHQGFHEEIKSYIGNIKSISVEFKQSDSKGSVAYGMLIIDKPYKFRFNYYAPFPLLIVGGDNYISFYNYEAKDLMREDASKNILYFMLSNDMDFGSHLKILSSQKKGKNYIIKLQDNNLNKEAELSFDTDSKHIKQMRIFEDDNIITLSFKTIQKITNISKSLFIIQNPDVFGEPDHLNKEELERKFTKIL